MTSIVYRAIFHDIFKWPMSVGFVLSLVSCGSMSFDQNRNFDQNLSGVRAERVLSLKGSPAFNDQLAASLAASPTTVRVSTVGANLTPANLGENLDGWLIAVEETGGTVRTVRERSPQLDGTRNESFVEVAGWVLTALAKQLWEEYRIRRRYSTVTGYSAFVVADCGTGIVQRVEFRRSISTDTTVVSPEWGC